MNVLEARRRVLGGEVIKRTAEGNPISVRSLARRYPGITMQGWTEQAQYEGKNLFDFSKFTATGTVGGSLDFENKIMVLNPTGIKDEYKTPDYQLFYAQSGFGCSPTARGRQVYGRFLADGEYTHFERSRFLGQLKPELVPDWAKEKVREFEKPSVKKQLAEVPKQPEQKTKNIDKGAR